ncbi:sulfate adenylyltransferase subunit 1 [Thermoflavifilum aggregans]|uniref:sulfate adenylyltransferase n=1 Tax=Thermoflavifilum aggregans TaxID=454188 RepID=A0A2M9CW40_9BACT|nr:GTP-binding protein [Thermoflavifilum aggregans]PJJ76105.1 sulfate adenylyltransferase subunit 1 [Thermoflavifilum aggregans]
MDLLRFTTSGSVDDGKSTLIGRLLYDSESIFVDQLQALQRASKHRGSEQLDLALITDGLRAEREQGITIDVAYKYFSTARRKFIIADTPGHIQYTRNMVTGASTANLAIILVDARQGVVEQTLRHTIIASILQIPHLVLCINKMDLVNYSEDRFYEIVHAYQEAIRKLNVKDVYYIPISALHGDNVVYKSDRMPWYTGKPLLTYLEEVPVAQDINQDIARFPVQYVIRPQDDAYHDYRGYAGKIISGSFHAGQAVTVWPSGLTSVIDRIEYAQQPLAEARAPQSVVILLKDDLDISRGDMITPADQPPTLTQDIAATICWMDSTPLKTGDKLLLQQGPAIVRCVVKNIEYKIDINTLSHQDAAGTLQLNDVARVQIRTAKPLAVDSYATNRACGSAILINETSYNTVAACLIEN